MAEETKPSPSTLPDGGPGAGDTGVTGGGVDVTKTVRIKLAGKDFDVPPELASAHEAREQEMTRKLSEQSGELGQLRKFRQDTEPILNQLRAPHGQTPSPDTPNLNVLWYENPEAAAKVVEDRVSQRLQAQYLQAEAIKSFWDGFYRENKDLREDEFVVKAVFSNKYAELAPMTVPDAQRRLADATREELLRISRKMKGETTPTNRSGELEEASGERTPKPKPEEVEEAQAPKSISEVIARRRQARRAVGTK